MKLIAYLAEIMYQLLKDIIKTTLRDRQLLGFSASLNETALDLLNNMMKEPEVINDTKEAYQS